MFVYLIVALAVIGKLVSAYVPVSNHHFTPKASPMSLSMASKDKFSTEEYLQGRNCERIRCGLASKRRVGGRLCPLQCLSHIVPAGGTPEPQGRA
eukprot:CAMPEP_0173176886 /NCGR_PEP_ID=MMETSP1141-20130122/4702_1 /TAXON_ID=483371 /ORGANISM="non described non described, Strain CCMP2298" /LENGTH=94 /DNA_ID=CAMNT_0014099261 /DNA_START=29 /DNA_END=310 /DNA_ORIENTATION=+